MSVYLNCCLDLSCLDSFVAFLPVFLYIVYLPVCLSFYPPSNLFVCLSARLSISLSVCIPDCFCQSVSLPAFSLFVRLPVYLPVSLPARFFVCLCLLVYLSVSRPACLFASLPDFLYIFLYVYLHASLLVFFSVVLTVNDVFSCMHNIFSV